MDACSVLRVVNLLILSFTNGLLSRNFGISIEILASYTCQINAIEILTDGIVLYCWRLLYSSWWCKPAILSLFCYDVQLKKCERTTIARAICGSKTKSIFILSSSIMFKLKEGMWIDCLCFLWWMMREHYNDA